MKKLFTFIAAALMAIGVNAQTWNFSTWEAKTFSETTTISGLTIAATSDYSVSIDENAKTVDGIAYTKRLKLGGSGSSEARNLSFSVSTNCTIEVVAQSSSSSADRELSIATGTFENVVNTMSAPGAAPAKSSYEYTGGATTIYVYSPKSGVNIYAIYVTEKEDPNAPKSDKYEAASATGMAKEFTAVVDANGNATNEKDGMSQITIKLEKATITAVGGTTPANDTEIGGAAQQIVPGAAVEGVENRYEVAEVKAWNAIKWEKKSQGDIDFHYVAGTGNPYVQLYATQNSKDGELVEGSYKADYVFYEPDGSKGLPITGLYYKFQADVKGAFKVKVWANKGNRKTFVVNEKEKKAQRLFASGYINGVNDANGSKRLLTVAEVDSVHNIYANDKILSAYKTWKEKNPESQADSVAVCDSIRIADQLDYIIGNGNQNFWGWLTFDAEPGESYLVFQHSSQIGFGGAEFYEGASAAELIGDIEAPFVYTTNFSTYTDDETGEKVPWKGEKIVGAGQFMNNENDTIFNYHFQNVAGTAPRQNYLLLPEDVLAHSAKSEALTIAVWVSADSAAVSSNYQWAPLFTAYAAQPNPANTWPMLALQYRGVLQVNDGHDHWTDYTDAQNVAGKNVLYHNDADWLADKKWHYYTAVFEGENAKVYFDGKVVNEWNNDGTTNTQKGLFENGSELKYICLGGNQAWDWNDLDAPFKFAKLLIKNSAMTAEEIAEQMKNDLPAGLDFEEYLKAQPVEPDPEPIPDEVKGIKNIDNAKKGAIYNMLGQPASANAKGMLIQDGKIFIK